MGMGTEGGGERLEVGRAERGVRVFSRRRENSLALCPIYPISRTEHIPSIAFRHLPPMLGAWTER